MRARPRLSWSKASYVFPPNTLMSHGGRFRISPINEPGMNGYALYDGGEHVATHRRRLDAKKDAEARS